MSKRELLFISFNCFAKLFAFLVYLNSTLSPLLISLIKSIINVLFLTVTLFGLLIYPPSSSCPLTVISKSSLFKEFSFNCSLNNNVIFFGSMSRTTIDRSLGGVKSSILFITEIGSNVFIFVLPILSSALPI